MEQMTESAKAVTHMEQMTFLMAATALVAAIGSCLIAWNAPSQADVERMVRHRVALQARLSGR